MPTLLVDDVSVAIEGRTFAGDLAALGPNYAIQIKLQESAWISPTLEHIRVFIQTPLAVAAIAGLSNQIVGFFLAWAREQRLKRPEQDQKKLTIYGPDKKPVRTIAVRGDRFEEE